jgi:hypothetical protein
LTAQFRLPDGAQISGGINTGREEIARCFVIDNPGGPTIPTFPNAALSGATQPGLGFSSWRADWCDIKPPFQTQLKALGSYPLPWYGIQVSGTFQVVPGPELSYASLQLTNNDVKTSLGRNLSSGANGTVTVPLMKPGTLYGDAWSKLDLRLTKIFRIGSTRVQGSLDVFNALNSPGVSLVNNVYGPNWLRPTLLTGPRSFRFSGQFDF